MLCFRQEITRWKGVNEISCKNEVEYGCIMLAIEPDILQRQKRFAILLRRMGWSVPCAYIVEEQTNSQKQAA